MKKTDELIGSNGKAVGDINYIECLNKNEFIGSIMKQTNKFDYINLLYDLNVKFQESINEIKCDLNNNINVIRFIPEKNRKELLTFILGINSMLEFIYKNHNNLNSCVSILTLSDKNANKKSNVSQSEIDKAVKSIISNTTSSRLSQKDKINLIKSAMEKGEKHILSDPIKIQYLKEISNGKGKEFFSDVYYTFFNLNQKGKFSGKCGRTICSKQYIDYFERKIFLKNIQDYYLSSNGINIYSSLIKSSLQNIANQIVKDILSGRNSNKYILYENLNNIKRLRYELIKCKININLSESDLEKYNLEDITDKLKKTMVRAEYTTRMYQKLPWVLTLTEFKNSVGNKKEFDLKNKPGWKARQYIFEGEVIDNDVPGNMLYGYLGKAWGFPDAVLYAGAGYAQLSAGTSKLSFLLTYFDDPRDNEAIRKEIKIYEQNH